MRKAIAMLMVFFALFPSFAIAETYFVFSTHDEEIDTSRDEQILTVITSGKLKADMLKAIEGTGLFKGSESWLTSQMGRVEYQPDIFFGAKPSSFTVFFRAGKVNDIKIEFAVADSNILKNTLSKAYDTVSDRAWNVGGKALYLTSEDGKNVLSLELPNTTAISNSVSTERVKNTKNKYNIKVTAAKKFPEERLMFAEGWQVSVRNNTGYTIDVLDVRMKFENAYNEPIVMITTAYNDISLLDIRVKDGAVFSNIGTDNYLPFPALGFDTTRYLYFTVSKYHTTSGETVTIPASEYEWFKVVR